MEVSMQAAAIAFALSFPLGILYGVIYDVIRFIRVVLYVDVRSPFSAARRKSVHAWFAWGVCALGDLCFFAVAAVLMCVFFFLTGDGRVRGYVLVGAFLGFLLYYHTVGRLFIGICAALAALFRRAVRAAARFCFYPLSRFGQFLRKSARPLVIRCKVRYNKIKEKRKAAAEKSARATRMQKCGATCSNRPPER